MLSPSGVKSIAFLALLFAGISYAPHALAGWDGSQTEADGTSIDVFSTMTSGTGNNLGGSWVIEYYPNWPNLTSPKICDSGSSFTYPKTATSSVYSTAGGGGDYDCGNLIGMERAYFIATDGHNGYYFAFSGSRNTANWRREEVLSCSGLTHICGFTPENGTTVSGPIVDFTMTDYINPADIGGNTYVKIKLHNIDQNVLLLGFLSPSDITLFDGIATTSGIFYFATSVPLGDGNYRLESSITESVPFLSWLGNPFGSYNQKLSKQFIVGEPTFIGNLSQNSFNILNGVYASTTATSSVALVARCNPLGSFDMTMCLAGLFVPDSQQIHATLEGARDGILIRAPWGYITRFVHIVSATTTESLPSYTATVALNNAEDTTELTFDPGDMVAGAGTLLDSIEDPYDHKSIKDVLQPMVQAGVAIAVVLTIISDIVGSHKHHMEVGDMRRRRQV